jgi:hypothetical protein
VVGASTDGHKGGPFCSCGQLGMDGMGQRDAQCLAALGVPKRDGARMQQLGAAKAHT